MKIMDKFKMRKKKTYGEMSKDFYYEIEDTFALKNNSGVVVVGINHNSPLYVGAEVDVLSGDKRLPTSIGGIEVYKTGMVDGVPEECNIGIMLTGLTKEDIHIGDIIVLRGCQKELNK